MALAAQAVSYSHFGFFQEDDFDETETGQNAMYEEFGILDHLFQNAQLAVLQRSQSLPANVETKTQNEDMHTFNDDETAEIEETEPSDSTDLGNVTMEQEPHPGCESVEKEVKAIDTKKETFLVEEEDHDTITQVDTTETHDTPVKKETLVDRKKHRSNRKERYQKKERKYRQVDPSDFGFYLLCRPCLTVIDPPVSDDEEEIAEEDTSLSSTDGNNTADESNPESTAVDSSIVSVSEMDKCDCDSNSNDIIQDDESFFADLGIDVNDSGSYWDEDDFLDWDGVRFSSPEKPTPMAKLNISQRKSSTSTKQKAIMKVTTIIDSQEYSLPNCKMTTSERIQLLELECNSSSYFYFRKDRHRKVDKIHVAVKSAHCTLENVINNKGRKRMYMHHRIFKKTQMDISFRQSGRAHILSMTSVGVDLKVAKAIRIKKPGHPAASGRPAPAQNLKHVLHETNLPRGLEMDLSGFLLSIQNRELTPEDYEMLLRLDDSVKAKTISNNVLKNLKTEPVGPEIANILICVICMEPYIEGQTRKFLPCEHDFHSECIDSWLANSSQNCPLDGLPIVDS